MTSPAGPYRSVDDRDPVQGVAPALVLVDPRWARNVGVAVRAASCYGIGQVWFTGSRVGFDLAGRGRLPREERMKGYRDVAVLHHERPLDRFPRGTVPVAVEVRDGAEALFEFVHPERAVYVFGPEDGSIPSAVLRHCHRHVVIPTRHCLNLAVSVGTVLYDRALKRALAGEADPRITPGEWEGRGGRDPLAAAIDRWMSAEG